FLLQGTIRMSSSLEAFVNDQKKKTENGSNGLIPTSFSTSFLSNKLTSSFSSFSLNSRSGDTEILIEGEGSRGVLPNGKNRKGTSSGGSWFSSDSSVFGLSRTQRLFGFFLFLVGAAFCFATSAFLLPVLLLQTRKFAALNTLGSVMLLASFVFIWGPLTYLSMLFDPSRRLVSVCYLSSVFATLYSSLWLKSYIFTILASTFQLFSFVWFIMSSVPGGERGLRFMASLFGRFITKPNSTRIESWVDLVELMS
ncbi:hypothetical protein PENTCL1PPCAC_6815, partial [Pristionchus entomophagus]